MSLAAALSTLSAVPQVRQAEDRVREATTQLRWHEGLRRRWNEARAENAIRTAVGVAALAGARVSAATLREEVASSAGILWQDPGPSQRQSQDPGRLQGHGQAEGQDQATAGPGGRRVLPADLAVALGAWHAAADVVSHFPPLSGRPGRRQAPPAPALLAGWHRSLTATRIPTGLVGAFEDRAGSRSEGSRSEGSPTSSGGGHTPGIPAAAQQAALVAELISGGSQGIGANVLARVALVQAELAAGAAFSTAGPELGVLAAWYVAVLGGLDPTGVAHPAALAVLEPAQYRHALAAYRTGSPAGVVEWIEFVARSWEEGARIGRAVCDSVLAGRTLG